MKTFFFILAFLLGRVFLLAQPYYTLPDSNATWISKLNTGPNWSYYIDSIPVSKNDTLINAKYYVKLYEADEMTPPQYVYLGAYRSLTSGQTWFVPKDSIQEYLIMDISKNKGDTIKYLYSEASSFAGDSSSLVNVVVDSVGYTTVGPYTLKYLGLCPLGVSVCFPPYWYWIEKIGCTSGFFNRFVSIPNNRYTVCANYNDTIYYNNNPTYAYGSCSLPTNTSEISSQINSVSVYPNPFYNSVEMLNNNIHANYTVNIFSSFGVLCESFILRSHSNISLNLRSLSSGLYVVMINDEQGASVTTKRIIKE